MEKSKTINFSEESRLLAPLKFASAGVDRASCSLSSKLEYIQQLSKFVPSLVIHKLITDADMKKQKDKGRKAVAQAQPVEKQLPELQSMETVVMFADISGFTNLSEMCAKNGTQGNEDLAFCINRYMEGMVKYLNQYGGDIIKFVGDAMIVMWPPVDTENQFSETLKVDTIRRAVQCSQDIQKEMHSRQIMPGITLSVKIGIGYGECGILYVGGVFNRAETLTVGEALLQALKSEGMATGGGQIVISQSCHEFVSDFIKAKRLKNEETNEVFYLVDNKFMARRVVIQADAIKLRQQFDQYKLQRIKKKLKGCVPHCVIPYLKIQQEKFASEIRSVSVMFLSLGVDLSSACTPEGIQLIQSIVTEVQKQVYRLQGSINKLVMDDKGSTMICIWGLLPFAHYNDAQRALLTGFNIIKALSKIKGTYCNIGVSSGECFTGVTGTSGSRKEFSVLGDIVNLAARIMGYMKGKKKNQVLCDLNTRMLSANTFEFIYDQHHELKGKSISIPFFKPIDPAQNLHMASQKVLRPQAFLKLHQNPMNIERDTRTSLQENTIGFQDLIFKAVDEVKKYYTEPGQDDPQINIIKGKIGSGKTAFMMNVLAELDKVPAFQPYLQRNKGKLPIFASDIDPETQLHFLNIWKPIFQMLLQFYCKRSHQKREHFIAECIIKSQNQDKTDLICEITGIQKQYMGAKNLSKIKKVEQIKPLPSEISFIKTVDYADEVKDELVEFLTLLFRCLIGEEQDVTEWEYSFDSDGNQIRRNDEDQALNSKRNQLISSEENEENSVSISDLSSDQAKVDTLLRAPIVLCLDNAQRMCPTSWQLLESITQASEHIVIFLIIRSDDRDRLMIQPESVAKFEDAWQYITQELPDLRIIDLPQLTPEQFGQVIVSNAALYKASYIAEVQEMTRIVDPITTIKDEQTSAQWRESLTDKYQLQYQIQSVDIGILKIISQKCLSNLLLSLQYFVNMLQNDFIRVNENGHVIPAEKFHKCQMIDDWTTVPVPRLSLRINMQSFSQFFFSIQSKGKKKKPGEIQGAITALVLLKVSSVLGREFQLEALKFISPLQKDTQHTKRLDAAIYLLEERDFIEVVDMNEDNKQLCRFVQPLNRESNYQMLRYKGCKKDLHTATEKYLQQMKPTSTLASMMEAHVNTEILLNHMLLAQNCDKEGNLMNERRTALTVQRIQDQIDYKPNSIIYAEFIYKLNRTKKVEKYITLNQFQLNLYQNQENYIRDKFTLRVKLQYIFEVTKVTDKEGNPGFCLGVSMHSTKWKKEAGKRDITFVCKVTEDRDKWTASIDYLKTRAIYQAYAKKNQLVSLGIFNQNIRHQSQEQTACPERDNHLLLYDFGTNFKSKTSQGAPIYSMQQNNTPIGRSSTMRNNSIIARNRRSLLRQNSLFSNEKAPSLVQKLSLLYKVGMTSFLHHLDRSQLQDNIVVGINHSEKQEVDQGMQLPQQDEQCQFLFNKELQLVYQMSQEMQRDSISQASDSSIKSGRKSLQRVNSATSFSRQNNPLQNKKLLSSKDKKLSFHKKANTQEFSRTKTLNEKQIQIINAQQQVTTILQRKRLRRVSSRSGELMRKSLRSFPHDLIEEQNEESSFATSSLKSENPAKDNFFLGLPPVQDIMKKNLSANDKQSQGKRIKFDDEINEENDHQDILKMPSAALLATSFPSKRLSAPFDESNSSRQLNKFDPSNQCEEESKDPRRKQNSDKQSTILALLKQQNDKISQMAQEQQLMKLQLQEYQQQLASSSPTRSPVPMSTMISNNFKKQGNPNSRLQTPISTLNKLSFKRDQQQHHLNQGMLSAGENDQVVGPAQQLLLRPKLGVLSDAQDNDDPLIPAEFRSNQDVGELPILDILSKSGSRQHMQSSQKSAIQQNNKDEGPFLRPRRGFVKTAPAPIDLQQIMQQQQQNSRQVRTSIGINPISTLQSNFELIKKQKSQVSQQQPRQLLFQSALAKKFQNTKKPVTARENRNTQRLQMSPQLQKLVLLQNHDQEELDSLDEGNNAIGSANLQGKYGGSVLSLNQRRSINTSDQYQAPRLGSVQSQQNSEALAHPRNPDGVQKYLSAHRSTSGMSSKMSLSEILQKRR